MKRKVYIETSVISYLTAKISRDLIVAGHQRLTQEWWATRREVFDVSVSQVVFEEASAGDPEAARERLAVLAALPLLELSADVELQTPGQCRAASPDRPRLSCEGL
jgi:hypothetical protein